MLLKCDAESIHCLFVDRAARAVFRHSNLRYLLWYLLMHLLNLGNVLLEFALTNWIFGGEFGQVQQSS